MLLQALKNAVILGGVCWFLFNLFVFLVTGGQGDPSDVHKPSILNQLFGLLISLAIFVALFCCIGLISVGLIKSYGFVKRTITSH